MDLNDKQKSKIADLGKEFGLKLILLFGSQANGKITKESDIDIAVLPRDILSFDEEIALANKLISILGEKVDFLNLQRASSLLMHEAVRNCVVLYQEDDSSFDKYFLYALRRFREARPLFLLKKERLKTILKSYAE